MTDQENRATAKAKKGERHMKIKGIGTIRKEDAKGGEVKINGKMLVGNFEKKILEEFGIRIQVPSPDDSKLADDSVTLTASGK